MKVISIKDGITFDDGTKIIDVHEQDCCEHVYADWKQLEDTGFLGKEIKEIEIEGVKESGFRINGFFVPCYDVQNGYYSSDLEIVIAKPDGKDKRVIDISEFVKHDID